MSGIGGNLLGWIVFLALAVLGILAWTLRVRWGLRFSGYLEIEKRAAGDAGSVSVSPIPKLSVEEARPRAVVKTHS